MLLDIKIEINISFRRSTQQRNPPQLDLNEF